MQKLYAAVWSEGGKIRMAKQVYVHQLFVKDNKLEALVKDERKKTYGEYRVIFNGEKFSCTCGNEECDHIYKVLLRAEKLTQYKRYFMDPDADYLYIRNGREIKRINLTEIELKGALKDITIPDKSSYSKMRVNVACESIGIEYETYGPRRMYFEEYNALINRLLQAGWRYEYDSSLPTRGGEIKSPPVKAEHKTIDKLVKKLEVLKLVSEHGPYSGFHVHVSFPEQLDYYMLEEFYTAFAQQLKNIEKYVNLPKLFGRDFNRYSERLGGYITRYCWLNLENLKSDVPTLEVRGGSTRAENYKDIIMFTIAMKDIIYGYYKSFKNNTPYHTNPFLYVRKELFKYIEPYVIPEAKLLLWQAYLRREG